MTKLGRGLLTLNSQAGLVELGWGTTKFMIFSMCWFLAFLLIILQIYNGTLRGFNGIEEELTWLSGISPVLDETF